MPDFFSEPDSYESGSFFCALIIPPCPRVAGHCISTPWGVPECSRTLPQCRLCLLEVHSIPRRDSHRKSGGSACPKCAAFPERVAFRILKIIGKKMKLFEK